MFRPLLKLRYFRHRLYSQHNYLRSSPHQDQVLKRKDLRRHRLQPQLRRLHRLELRHQPLHRVLVLTIRQRGLGRLG